MVVFLFVPFAQINLQRGHITQQDLGTWEECEGKERRNLYQTDASNEFSQQNLRLYFVTHCNNSSKNLQTLTNIVLPDYVEHCNI